MACDGRNVFGNLMTFLGSTRARSRKQSGNHSPVVAFKGVFPTHTHTFRIFLEATHIRVLKFSIWRRRRREEELQNWKVFRPSTIIIDDIKYLAQVLNRRNHLTFGRNGGGAKVNRGCGEESFSAFRSCFFPERALFQMGACE